MIKVIITIKSAMATFILKKDLKQYLFYVSEDLIESTCLEIKVVYVVLLIMFIDLYRPVLLHLKVFLLHPQPT